jgi:hypothetical protein
MLMWSAGPPLSPSLAASEFGTSTFKPTPTPTAKVKTYRRVRSSPFSCKRLLGFAPYLRQRGVWFMIPPFLTFHYMRGNSAKSWRLLKVR